MSNPDETEDNISNVPEDKVEREVMVEYLTSTGKVRPTVAERLYEEGLDNWASLVKGDDSYFTSFKGVGKKTSEELLILAKAKEEELSKKGEAPSLKETLSGIPRVSDKVIGVLMEGGFDTYQTFKGLDPKELTELKGIGPKLSLTIVERVNQVIEEYEIDEKKIEDATGVLQDGSPEGKIGEIQEKGFFQKLIEGIKAIFTGPKKEDETEKETDQEKPLESKEEKEVSESQDDGTPSEVVDEKGDIEKEAPEEVPKQEVVTEDEDSTSEGSLGEEVSGEAETPEETEEVTDKETEESPEDNKQVDASQDEEAPKGLFQKLKNMLFGKKDEEDKETELPEKEEEPTQDEKSPGEGDIEEREDDVSEEESPEKDEQEPEKDEVESEKSVKEAEVETTSSGPLGIPGISAEDQEKLITAGYLNIEELREAVPEDLVMVEGIDQDTAERICDAVKE